MLDYAFAVLGLHNVMLTVFDFNPAGLRAYEKAGFREFGRRRQSHRMGGELRDEIFMQCLSDELESPVLGRLSCGEKDEGQRPGDGANVPLPDEDG